MLMNVFVNSSFAGAIYVCVYIIYIYIYIHIYNIYYIYYIYYIIYIYCFVGKSDALNTIKG